MQDFAYKILTTAEFDDLIRDKQKGSFDSAWKGSPVDLVDQFIHLSSATQVSMVANKYFINYNQIHVLAFKTSTLNKNGKLKYEAPAPPRPEERQTEMSLGMLFPHLYEPLDLNLAIQIYTFEKKQDRFDIALE